MVCNSNIYLTCNVELQELFEIFTVTVFTSTEIENCCGFMDIVDLDGVCRIYITLMDSRLLLKSYAWMQYHLTGDEVCIAFWLSHIVYLEIYF